MDDLQQKLIVAFVAFLLGLLAESIKRFFQKEKKRIRYVVQQRPVIAIDENLPQAVLSKVPGAPSGNVSEFKIEAVNAGDLPIAGANLLIVPNKEAQLLHYEVQTTPLREVAYGIPEHPNQNELRIPNINIEKSQIISVSVFFLSKEHMGIELYWSGGGGMVDWETGEDRFTEGAAYHVEGIIRNYIFSEIVSVFLQSLGYLAVALVPIPMLERNQGTMFGISIGQFFAASFRLYFLLRIVPHAIALVEMYRIRTGQRR